MDVHRAAGPVKLITPDGVEQLIPGKHGPGPLHQQTQDLKLLQRQGNLPLPVPNDVPGGVHKQSAQGVGAALWLPLPAVAQGGTDPGHQLHHSKGLCHVVIRPLVQAQHLVVLRALGGEQDDRQGPGGRQGAQALEHLEPVLLRQHNVQQKQVRRPPLQRLPELGGTLKALRLHPLALDGIDHQLSDAGVIL